MMDGTDYGETKPYRPSNGTEGMEFEARFCDRCRRDAKYRRTQDGADGCPILAAVFMHEVDDPKYPKEWIVNKWGDPYERTSRCTAFRFNDGPSRPRKSRPAPLLDLMRV